MPRREDARTFVLRGRRRPSSAVGQVPTVRRKHREWLPSWPSRAWAGQRPSGRLRPPASFCPARKGPPLSPPPCEPRPRESFAIRARSRLEVRFQFGGDEVARVHPPVAKLAVDWRGRLDETGVLQGMRDVRAGVHVFRFAVRGPCQYARFCSPCLLRSIISSSNERSRLAACRDPRGDRA